MDTEVILENVWGSPETEFLNGMRRTQDLSVLVPLGQNLKWPNAFQSWKDADFTLLFHTSIINNTAAVHLLLKAGADPTRAASTAGGAGSNAPLRPATARTPPPPYLIDRKHHF